MGTDGTDARDLGAVVLGLEGFRRVAVDEHEGELELGVETTNDMVGCLARTLDSWRDELLARFTVAGVSNGPTEARSVTVSETHALERFSGGSVGPGFLGRLRERQARRDYEASVLAFANALRGEFREACTGLGICHYVQVAAGVTVRTPRVGEVRVGPPSSLTVELLPGQEPGDFTARRTGPGSRTPSAPTGCGSSRSPGVGCGCTARRRPAARRLRPPARWPSPPEPKP